MGTDGDGEEHPVWHEVLHLVRLTAEMQVDVHPRDIKGGLGQIQLALTQVLQRTLSQIRAITGDLNVDPHAPGRALLEYSGDSPGEMRTFLGDFNFHDFSDLLTPDVWNQAVKTVKQPRDTEVQEELFLEARAFAEQGNNRMAVMCAAIAAEACTQRMLAASLTSDRVDRGKADSFITRLSRRTDQPILLRSFDLLHKDLIVPLNELFEQRNSIAHGGARKLTSADQAKTAISTASKVREAYRVWIDGLDRAK